MSIADQQELVILDALCEKQLTVADLEEKLADARFTALSTGDVEELLDRMEEDHLIVQFQATREVVGAGITDIGKERLGELRVLALRIVEQPPTLSDSRGAFTDRVEEIRKRFEEKQPPAAPRPTFAVCNVPEVPAGADDIATVCMTRASLDAWWDTLTSADKAEVITEYYEALAAQNADPKNEVRG